MVWTDDRIDELELLEHLLNEVTRINSGNCVLERLQQLILDAGHLLGRGPHSSSEPSRLGFWPFLVRRIRKEVELERGL